MLIISLCPKDILYAILLMPLGSNIVNTHEKMNLYGSLPPYDNKEKKRNHIYNLILFFIFLVVALHTFVLK
jgi:hypothetical protein